MIKHISAVWFDGNWGKIKSGEFDLGRHELWGKMRIIVSRPDVLARLMELTESAADHGTLRSATEALGETGEARGAGTTP